MPDSDRQVDIVVVGAGIGGLYAVHRFRQLGFDVLGVERADDVGGTWYWNKYPGARVDTYSLNYSYGFDDDLQQEWEWSERYATQPEIHAYLRTVADRYDLRQEFLLGTTVVRANFDQRISRWMVETDNNGVIEAQFVVTAAGVLSATQLPDIPGIEEFEGRCVHTSRWPADLDARGLRVGIVGTGSTGVQLTPRLAEIADEVYVFQRTPNFCIPQRNGPVQADLVEEWKARYPQRREEARYAGGGSFPNLVPQFFAHEIDEDHRAELLEKAWAEGSAPHMMTVFKDVFTSAEANGYVATFIREKIRAVVKDPTVADLLTPTDHHFATKRPVMEDGYYESFNRDNVHLVDVRTDPIVRVTPHGVQTGTTTYEVDVLVLATGFDAITGPLFRMNIKGRDGLNLREKWRDGPSTYLGMATEGFPNLFFLTGPGSPSVLGNVFTSLELHVDWIAELLTSIREQGLTEVEATRDGEDEWTGHVRAAADSTLFGQAASWYSGANVPGKPRVFLPFVGGVGNYRRACEQAAAEGYPGLRMSVAGGQGQQEHTKAATS